MMTEFIRKLLNLKISQYALIGGSIALFDLVFFYLFAVYLAFNYLWINALGFIVATFLNYYLCIRYVFVSGVRFTRKTEIAAIFLISGITLVLNQLIIYGLLELAMLPKMLAKILTVLSLFLWNYLTRKHIVFQKSKTHEIHS